MKSIFDQLPSMAYYKSDRLKGNYKDIIFNLGKVSLNKDYYFTRWLEHNNVADFVKINEDRVNNAVIEVKSISKKTIFNEVKSCTYKPHKNISKLADSETNRTKRNIEDIAKNIKNQLLIGLDKVISVNTKPIVVPHSAGLDSRILSLLLRELGIKKDVYLICHQPEIELFKEIIKVEDYWNKENIITIRENHEPLDYSDESVDFYSLGTWIFEINKALHEEWFIRKEIERLGNNVLIISGITANQVWNNEFSNIGHFLIKQFYNVHYQYENDYPIYYPTAYSGVIEIAMNNQFTSNIAKEVIKVLDEKVYNIINYDDLVLKHKPYGNHIPYCELSDKTRLKMYHDFKNSWLYKNWNKLHQFNEVPKSRLFIPKTRNEYIGQFFLYYSMASICEYFINRGVEIEI